ncbi:MAG: hypothetical protein C0459_03665 [Chitinophaga sp.]|jgi:hypothetical protein|nr:hypothetical protein [Chitinophaga sp.]
MEEGLQNIILPNAAIVDLYNKHLVVIEGVEKVEKKVAKQPAAKQNNELIFLGDNKKNIAIAVNDETATYLRDEWLQLLTNMLTACKLNIGDVAIINMHKQPTDFIQLKEKINPSFCLLFGVKTNALDLPFVMPDYQIQKHNNCSFITAPSFAAMEGNSQEAKIEKSKLWVCLKQLFNI